MVTEDSNLQLRWVGVLFETRVKTLFRLGEQGGHDMLIDRDHVEKHLVPGLPLGGHFRRHRPRAREP